MVQRANWNKPANREAVTFVASRIGLAGAIRIFGCRLGAYSKDAFSKPTPILAAARLPALYDEVVAHSIPFHIVTTVGDVWGCPVWKEGVERTLQLERAWVRWMRGWNTERLEFNEGRFPERITLEELLPVCYGSNGRIPRKPFKQKRTR